jgi:hypothetical protein
VKEEGCLKKIWKSLMCCMKKKWMKKWMNEM